MGQCLVLLQIVFPGVHAMFGRALHEAKLARVAHRLFVRAFVLAPCRCIFERLAAAVSALVGTNVHVHSVVLFKVGATQTGMRATSVRADEQISASLGIYHLRRCGV